MMKMVTYHYDFTVENNHWANYLVRKWNGEPFKHSLSSAVTLPEKNININGYIGYSYDIYLQFNFFKVVV